MKYANIIIIIITIIYIKEVTLLINKKYQTTCVTFLGLIIFGCSLMQPLSTGG